MKKLSSLFAITGLLLTFAAIGCKKGADEGKAPAGKVEEKGAADTVAKPDEKKPDDKPTATAGGGDLPKECTDYKEAMDKYFSCDKIPQAARDAAKQGFQQAWDAWEKVPAGEARDALKDACKQAGEAAKALTCPG